MPDIFEAAELEVKDLETRLQLAWLSEQRGDLPHGAPRWLYAIAIAYLACPQDDRFESSTEAAFVVAANGQGISGTDLLDVLAEVAREAHGLDRGVPD